MNVGLFTRCSIDDHVVYLMCGSYRHCYGPSYIALLLYFIQATYYSFGMAVRLIFGM